MYLGECDSVTTLPDMLSSGTAVPTILQSPVPMK